MARTVFLVMPEWQGSSSSRAMQLADGAAVLREDLPVSARRDIEVPLEAGDALGTPVARLSSLLRAREAAAAVLSEVRAEGAAPILLGGDDATALPGIESALAGTDPARLAVLWFDAHACLQHPSTSPTGAAAGMTLRHALGTGAEELNADPALDPGMITLLGTRAVDPEEDVEIERSGITRFDATAPALPSSVRERLIRSEATAVYVHVDLDVIDPAEFSAVHSPEPFGMPLSVLTDTIRAAVRTLPLAGASIAEFAPADARSAGEDLPSVLRILGALTAGGDGDRRGHP